MEQCTVCIKENENPTKDGRFIKCADAKEFIVSLSDNSIDLLLMDPPYNNVINNCWDNQWKNDVDYAEWFLSLLRVAKFKMKEHGSIIFFGGIGKHNNRSLFKTMILIEQENLFYFRNSIVWSKKRAYGKSHDYLFTREEIVWYSVSPERTNVRFNIPLLNEKRGYQGFNKNHPAKSEYKRVTNVWTDITELFKTERVCQKPIPLMKRLIETHSNPGDLVVDCFTGFGSTGIAALELGREFLGCERIEEDAIQANERCKNVIQTKST